jgi:hypothetical protein
MLETGLIFISAKSWYTCVQGIIENTFDIIIRLILEINGRISNVLAPVFTIVMLSVKLVYDLCYLNINRACRVCDIRGISYISWLN